MKLPSVTYLVNSAKESFLRFPLTILSSLFASSIGIFLFENAKKSIEIFPLLNLMLCFAIGIPLFFCVTVVANKKQIEGRNKVLINIFAALLLVLIYFTFPNSESTHNTSLPYVKYALYNITCHLLVSFVPFIFSTQMNGFWNYNKILFLRFLLSCLYSGFIYIGLVLALGSMQLLFDVKIHENLYFDIWVGTMCFFNSWFFVGGIPSDYEALEANYDYPKGLKTFAQYVLLPLLALYLFILYSYGTKIVLAWDWPKGIVSYLIICVSVLGILAFLLLHPYGNKEENAWIKKASRGYYFLLIPLLVLLFIAIFMRVDDYGITINRYAIVLLGVWLSIVCLYTALGKTNIKFIPTSLAILLVLISFGPWGMFSYSENSQVTRLKKLLETHKLLVDNKIMNEAEWMNDSITKIKPSTENKNDGLMPDSSHNEVKSILEYLDDHHGFSAIRGWFKQDIDSVVTALCGNEAYRFSEVEIYMRSMGLKYEFKDENGQENTLSFNSDHSFTTHKVSGYDYFVEFDYYQGGGSEDRISVFEIDSMEYKLEYIKTPTATLLLKRNSEQIEFNVDSLVGSLKSKFGLYPTTTIPQSNMCLLGSSQNMDIKIEIQHVVVGKQSNKQNINSIDGGIFIKFKN